MISMIGKWKKVKSNSGSEKSEIRSDKSESGSDPHLVSLDDVDKFSGAGDSTNQPLTPWNHHWVHCLYIIYNLICDKC